MKGDIIDCGKYYAVLYKAIEHPHIFCIHGKGACWKCSPMDTEGEVLRSVNGWE